MSRVEYRFPCDATHLLVPCLPQRLSVLDSGPRLEPLTVVYGSSSDYFPSYVVHEYAAFFVVAPGLPVSINTPNVAKYRILFTAMLHPLL